MKKIAALTAICAGLCTGAVWPANADDLIASFYDMSDASFSLEAIAPRDVIRQFAVCKAVWFAEKKHVANMSLSNPVYGSPRPAPVQQKMPDGWIALQATAYLTAPNPDGNPTFSVAEKAGPCRQYWSWYR
jgi:hypothetical protein